MALLKEGVTLLSCFSCPAVNSYVVIISLAPQGEGLGLICTVAFHQQHLHLGPYSLLVLGRQHKHCATQSSCPTSYDLKTLSKYFFFSDYREENVTNVTAVGCTRKQRDLTLCKILTNCLRCSSQSCSLCVLGIESSLVPVDGQPQM